MICFSTTTCEPSSLSAVKNIVLCCDGTNNQFSGCHTNVIRLYKVAAKIPGQQVVFYDPGVGTMPETGWRTQLGKRWSMLAGLAFGTGFFDNISNAYRFLMREYEAGDQVYIFGFSRGAFAARAVGGLLYAIGLLRPGTENLLPYALRYWQQAKTDEGRRLCAEFKTTLARECKPHFIGVWDTVGSVGFVNHFKTFPFTQHNPDVAIVRHAVSIDERRCAFRHNLMEVAPENPRQDVKNVWFAGVHSDVGGGYSVSESGLAKIAFEWMVRESKAGGLVVDQIAYDHEMAECLPNPLGPMHNSLTGGWWILEVLPHRIYSYEDKRRHWRFEWNKPRFIKERPTFHRSVIERMRLCPEYVPVNLCSTDPNEVVNRFAIEE